MSDLHIPFRKPEPEPVRDHAKIRAEVAPLTDALTNCITELALLSLEHRKQVLRALNALYPEPAPISPLLQYGQLTTMTSPKFGEGWGQQSVGGGGLLDTTPVISGGVSYAGGVKG